MTDAPLMAGTFVLVTGGTGGIGRATASGLAALGARVGITGRDQARTEAAAAAIRAGPGNPAVDAFAADMSVQAGVRRLAARVLGAYPRLDVLVNNAGGFWAHRHVTADGLEHTFALNHLAPFLLTSLLLDRLTASAPARIVTVSSGAHASGRTDFDDLQGERNYSGQRAYSQSKLANVMFTYELTRRLEGTGVTATVLHPGVVRTSFGARRPDGALRRHDPRGAPVHEDPGAGRDHPDLPRFLTRGRGHHRPVLHQSQTQDLQQGLLRHHSRHPAVAGQRRPDRLAGERGLDAVVWVCMQALVRVNAAGYTPTGLPRFHLETAPAGSHRAPVRPSGCLQRPWRACGSGRPVPCCALTGLVIFRPHGGSLDSAYEGSGPDQVRPARCGSDLRGGEAGCQGQWGARQGSCDDGESDGLRLPGCQALLHEILHRAYQATGGGPGE